MDSPYRYERTRIGYEVRQGPDLICTCDSPVVAGRIVAALNLLRRQDRSRATEIGA